MGQILLLIQLVFHLPEAFDGRGSSGGQITKIGWDLSQLDFLLIRSSQKCYAARAFQSHPGGLGKMLVLLEKGQLT